MSHSLAAKGNHVGNYLGHPIPEKITTRNGVYVFDRIAENLDGEYPLSQLSKGELLIRPGLIYKPE